MTLILNVLAAATGLALTSVAPIQAQSLYWDANGTTAGTGAASTNNWDTATSNWNTDATGVAAPGLWADGNIAVFSAGTDGTGIQTITVSGTINPLGITVEEGAVNLSGGTLDLGGDTVSVASGTSTISSVVSGSGILTKSGGGTLILSGSNTFTGTMTTGAGTLRATASVNALGTGAATVNLNGGTLWLANDASLAFNRNTTVSTATTVTLGRLTAGNGGQTFAMGTLAMGSSILTVNADNATLNVANNAATTLTFGATTFSADATFNIVNSTATGGNTTVSLGAITDSGLSRNLIKNGNGRLTLTAANSYGGKTTVNAGLLSIGAEDRLGANPAAYAADQLTLNGGGLEASASFTLDDANRGISLGSSGGTLDVNSGATLTLVNSMVISGSGNLTKADAGTLILGNANTYTGTTIVTGGVLRVDQNIASGGGAGQLGNSTAAIQVASASLLTSGAYTINRGVQVNASGGITTLGTSATSGTTVYAANITSNNVGNSQQLNLRADGTSRVEINGNIVANTTVNSDGDSSVYTSTNTGGTGTVVLAGNNNYRGYTQVSASTTLVARHNNALGTNTGSMATGVVSGGTLELQNNITTPEEIIINGTGLAAAGALKSSGGNNTVNGGVTLGSASTVNSATAGQTLTLAGNVKADYALTVTGAGNTTISGVISGQTGYVAGLREGRLTGGSNFVGYSASTPSAFNPGGAQVLSPIAGYTNDKTAAGKWNDSETWVYTGQFYDADGNFSFAENIDDSVQVVVDGVVRLNNGSYNTVTNTTTTIGAPNGGGTTAGANTGTPTTDYGMGPNGDGWHTIEIRFGNGSGGAGAVVSAGQGWTATKGFGYSASGATTYVAVDFAVLVDDGSGNLLRTQVSNSLTKTGAGILTLSNANTYAGPTVVSEGTLLVTNTTGSGTGTGAVTAASGGSLGGTGRIAGSTVVSVGGRLIMGADTAAVGTDFGIGTLTFDSSLTVSGTINFDLASSTVFDKLSVGGLLSLDANTIINVNLGTFTPTGSEVFDIIDASSIALNGFNPDSLGDLVLPSLAPGYQWDTTRFASDGIIAIAVPEPSRMILFFMGFAALVLRRKRAKG